MFQLLVGVTVADEITTDDPKDYAFGQRLMRKKFVVHGVHHDTQDLINRLLNPDHPDRISAKKALKAPFLVNHFVPRSLPDHCLTHKPNEEDLKRMEKELDAMHTWKLSGITGLEDTREAAYEFLQVALKFQSIRETRILKISTKNNNTKTIVFWADGNISPQSFIDCPNQFSLILERNEPANGISRKRQCGAEGLIPAKRSIVRMQCSDCRQNHEVHEMVKCLSCSDMTEKVICGRCAFRLHVMAGHETVLKKFHDENKVIVELVEKESEERIQLLRAAITDIEESKERALNRLEQIRNAPTWTTTMKEEIQNAFDAQGAQFSKDKTKQLSKLLEKFIDAPSN